MKGIKVENVTFTYPNGYTAVENVTLNISQGESIAIIGQNGAGKTTMVKLLNALLRPNSGSIIIDDVDIAELTTAETSKKVGYVFQNPGDQIFNNNVYDEIAYILRYNKLPETEVEELVMDAAELCGIVEYLRVNPYDLPFSLRKFVTIAVVIAMGSKYVILDEPTAGQDYNGLISQKNIIEELIKRNRTVITITHDMEFVIENFHRVIVMANKKVIADANKEEIFWNFDILAKSSLKQPVISQLARELGLGGNVISIEKFINNFK